MRKTKTRREATPDGAATDRAAELMRSSAIPVMGRNNAPDPIQPLELSEDILHGAAEIAAYINVDHRRAFYLLEKGYIPAVKTGATWTSTKSRLRRHFNGE
jgi:hypothetical protein